MEDDRTEPKRLLIVDDDEAITSSLASLLGSDAVVVRTASTWEHAVELLETQTFDLVITDLRLSGTTGMEGLELISMIKTRLPQTRVVLLTGYGSPEVERQARERGADAYLDKTLPISMLVERVRALGLSMDSAGSERRCSA
ncbi:MAG: response regulator [Blastocatellia bacterium]|nr:response regulator [Blastocatellia bacterium]MDW8167886.1 response regulator [Acidobacteriota bacterium]